ncbi:MAG: sugar-binding protein, partial [Candidatus Omnitrophota bacterium]|nr:sugar-binding protein [Candidatus Omnitrophota bacterium]
MKTKSLITAFAILVIALFTSLTYAATIEVHNGQLIQNAISSAQAGDTVLVFNEGSDYVGNVGIKAGVTLLAKDGLGEPVIKGTVTMQNNTTLKGFKVSPPAYPLAGYSSTAMYVTGVSNINIIQNSISAYKDYWQNVDNAYGIKIDNASGVYVYNNLVKVSSGGITAHPSTGGSIGISGVNLSAGALRLINNMIFASANEGFAAYPQTHTIEPYQFNSTQDVRNNILLKQITLESYYSWRGFGQIISGFNLANIGGAIDIDQQFVNFSYPYDYHLKATSLLKDAGDPTILDADGSRSDIGMYGGVEFIKIDAVKLPTGAAITIDGLPNEPEWASLPWVDFSFSDGNIPADNTTAKAKFLWDKENIYVLVDVYDQHVETAGPTDYWDSDTIETYFARRDNGNAAKDRCSIGGPHDGPWQNARAYSLRPGTTEDNNSNLDTGYLMEFKINANSLGMRTSDPNWVFG